MYLAYNFCKVVLCFIVVVYLKSPEPNKALDHVCVYNFGNTYIHFIKKLFIWKFEKSPNTVSLKSVSAVSLWKTDFKRCDYKCQVQISETIVRDEIAMLPDPQTTLYWPSLFSVWLCSHNFELPLFISN